jgi:hypothetical protein
MSFPEDAIPDGARDKVVCVAIDVHLSREQGGRGDTLCVASDFSKVDPRGGGWRRQRSGTTGAMGAAPP